VFLWRGLLFGLMEVLAGLCHGIGLSQGGDTQVLSDGYFAIVFGLYMCVEGRVAEVGLAT
jgi:hypothetical protein